MSQIKVLYNEYVEKEYRPTEEWMGVADLLDADGVISSAADRETEAAFFAGFQSAMRLMKETLE